MNLRQLLRFSVVLFLIFPFLFLLFQFRIEHNLDWSEIFWAVKNTVYQAFFSALAAVFFGLITALSLIKVKNFQARKALEFLCLVPNLLPTIFILLSTLKAINYFPMGTLGIVIIHTIINLGLVAVIVAEILEVRIGKMAFVAYAAGASKILFYRKILIPSLYKHLLQVFLFVFVMCFGSFSVPLVVGGGRGTTLEVLIYEKIRLSQEWGAAIYISVIQSAFIFLLSLFLYKHSNKKSFPGKTDLSYYGSYFGFLVVLALVYIFVIGYGGGIVAGFSHLNFVIDNRNEILQLTLGTIWVGLAVGFLSAVLLTAIVYLSHARWFVTFLNGYVTPSTALASFSFLAAFNAMAFNKIIAVPVVIVLLGICGLYRLGLHQALEELRSQARLAYIMGAKPWMIFSKIVLPQCSDSIGKLAAISAVWACGDFAISRIVANKTFTLAMMTDALMSGYRLNHAVLISFFIIICAVLCYLLIQGVFNVIGQKLKS